MNLDNFLVRPHRRWVEQYSDWAAWESLTKDDAGGIQEHLAALPSSAIDTDEEAKRFDLLVLRRQLAQLHSDAVEAEKLRKTIQEIAAALLAKTTIPSVAEQSVLLESVAGDEWWVDVTLPMLETARTRLRSLVRFIEKTRRNPVYTDFEDELGEATAVDLPGVTPGTDLKRFHAKVAAYLKEHEDHVALQRLRRNKQLTPADLTALEEILIAAGGQQADIAEAAEQSGGLGLFIRSLVGLDRSAAIEAFSEYLDDTRFSVNQVRFVELIVDELTASGVMEPGRLYESPYTDHAPTGPDNFFPEEDHAAIIETLRDIKQNAIPAEAA